MHSLLPPYEPKLPVPERRSRRAVTAGGLPPGQMTLAQVRAMADRADRSAEALRRADLPGRVLDRLHADLATPGRLRDVTAGPLDWLRGEFSDEQIREAALRVRNRAVASADRTRPTHLPGRVGRRGTAGGRGPSDDVARRTGITARSPAAAQPSARAIVAASRRGVSERDILAATRLGIPLRNLRASGEPADVSGVRGRCGLVGHGPNCVCDGVRRQR